jgi:hypothetical protein
MALSQRVERPALEPPLGTEVKKTCEAAAYLLIVWCLINAGALLSLLLVYLDGTRNLNVRCKKLSANETWLFVGKEMSLRYFQDLKCSPLKTFPR